MRLRMRENYNRIKSERAICLDFASTLDPQAEAQGRARLSKAIKNHLCNRSSSCSDSIRLGSNPAWAAAGSSASSPRSTSSSLTPPSAARCFSPGSPNFAVRRDKPAYLAFIRRYGLFLLIFSYVLGSITGPGIWFAATIASPRGISALIHSFVWLWASEWVFFVIEVIGVYLLVYLAGRVDRPPTPASRSSSGWRPSRRSS